jgi:hypothetical protein
MIRWSTMTPSPRPCQTRGGRPRVSKALACAGPIRAREKDAHVVIEATGVGQAVFDIMQHTAPGDVEAVIELSWLSHID